MMLKIAGCEPSTIKGCPQRQNTLGCSSSQTLCIHTLCIQTIGMQSKLWPGQVTWNWEPYIILRIACAYYLWGNTGQVMCLPPLQQLLHIIQSDCNVLHCLQSHEGMSKTDSSHVLTWVRKPKRQVWEHKSLECMHELLLSRVLNVQPKL